MQITDEGGPVHDLKPLVLYKLLSFCCLLPEDNSKGGLDVLSMSHMREQEYGSN